MVVVPFVPIIGTDRLVSSSVPEPDPGAGELLWSPGVDYALDAEVVRLGTHRRYRCVAPGVHAGLPEETPTRWQKLGVTNKFLMFDYGNNRATEVPESLVCSIVPNRRIDSFVLRGVRALNAQVEMTVGGQQVYASVHKLSKRRTRGWRDYFFGTFDFVFTLPLFDLPPFASATVTVTLTNPGGSVRVERCLVGTKVHIGHVEWSAISDVLNFSVIDRDSWGNTELQPIPNLPATQQRLEIAKDRVDTARKVRTELDAVPAFWSGLDDQRGDGYAESLDIFGIYRKFRIDLRNPKKAYINLDLEEV